MKDRNQIHHDLIVAEKKARSGKFRKLIRGPVLYPSLMLFNYAWYPLLKKGMYVRANTFFGLHVRTLLPSGTDILLNGIKSHDSEIRLAKYLTRTLQQGDIFIDVGAHNGYYSLLACVLTGGSGKVYSIEASHSSYADLKENVTPYPTIEIFHAAAGDHEGSITFYEYPGPYAEYNTTVPGAYTHQKWFRRVKETVNTVPVLMLKNLIKAKEIEKAFIKVDVEGGEAAVLRGLNGALKEKSLIIAMEYLLPAQGSRLHHEAAEILYRERYRSYAIGIDGDLIAVVSIDQYLQEQKLTSDNIIFKKP